MTRFIVRSFYAIVLCLAVMYVPAHAATPLPAGDWCSASGQSVTIPPCAVVPPVQPPVGSCPAGRQLTSQVTYDYGRDARRPGDITSMALFGKIAAADTLRPMPWAQGSHPTIYAFPQTGYIALQFVATAASGTGVIYHSETLPGPDLVGSISQRCGDFTPGVCTNLRPASPGQGIVGWKVGAGGVAYCPLVQGQTYYLNLKVAQPTAPGGYSVVTLLSNHTP